MLRLCCRGMAAACLAAGLCLPALAQEPATGTASPTAPARAFTPSEHMMHQILASYFGLTHEQVMDLAARGYTYEQIATAANLAARSGRPLADITAMRDRPMEFAEIANQVGVSPDDVNRPVAPSPMMRVAAERTTMAGGAPAAGGSPYAMPPPIHYGRRYQLAPVDMKRLRAMGLRDPEIYRIANAAHETGFDIDYLAQAVFRGVTVNQAADELGVPVSDLERVRPEWQTPEWEAAVQAGLWYFPGPAERAAGHAGMAPGEGGMAPAPRTSPGRGRRNRGGRGGGQGAGSSPDMTR